MWSVAGKKARKASARLDLIDLTCILADRKNDQLLDLDPQNHIGESGCVFMISNDFLKIVMFVHSFVYVVSNTKERDIIHAHHSLPMLPVCPKTDVLPNSNQCCMLLLRRLFLQISLNTTLPRLALVVLLLRFRLLRLVTRQTSDSTTNRSSNTILNALAKVANLSLSFLGLALLVLLDAFLLQALSAHEATEGFFCSTDVLVP
tara:strand:- start:18848 stop:19459 length:612 start_codon:yes stop_codon:yes gene_type:complete